MIKENSTCFHEEQKIRDLIQARDQIRKDVNDLENALVDPSSGFGDPDARQKHLDTIQVKKDEETRTERKLDQIRMYRIEKSALKAKWFSAITAVFLAPTFIHFIWSVLKCIWSFLSRFKL